VIVSHFAVPKFQFGAFRGRPPRTWLSNEGFTEPLDSIKLHEHSTATHMNSLSPKSDHTSDCGECRALRIISLVYSE